VPLSVAVLAAQAAELGAEAAEVGNVNAISDAASAVALARAALSAAALNVRINARSLADPLAAADWERRLNEAEQRAEAAGQRVTLALRSRSALA
jgi:glutamate formiminotransferase/formiminotetrahydrofolate cyclodeaminase